LAAAGKQLGTELEPKMVFSICIQSSFDEESDVGSNGSLELHNPLLRQPVDFPANRSQFPLVNRLLPGRVRRQKQQLLLNRWAEQVEIEDLRHSWLGNVAEPSELRDASHLAAVEHALIFDC
jgi:hypothetical protein